MPAIEWKALLKAVQDHLLGRLRVRQITAQDLRTLLDWINSNPQVPDGAWWKDFGSFKLVGEGSFPKTFLTKGQPCCGEKI